MKTTTGTATSLIDAHHASVVGHCMPLFMSQAMTDGYRQLFIVHFVGAKLESPMFELSMVGE